MIKLSIGKCGRKQCYLTEADAIIAASRRLRDYKRDLDWTGFRTYQCPSCGHFHLTKERR